MAKYRLVCACGYREAEESYIVDCPQCSGLLEVQFESKPSFPDFTDRNFSSALQFHRVMPFMPDGGGMRTIEAVKPTPEIVSENLGPRLGIELIYKNELTLPTGTWKDREGTVLAHRFSVNDVSDLVAFSAGNSGASMAWCASLMKKTRLHLVVPKENENRLSAARELFDSDFVRIHLFDGSNDECAAYAEDLAARMGCASEGGFKNYARREGLKLFALEFLAGATGKVDWYAQAVAGGIGVYSFFKAYSDLGIEDRCPKILGVQAEACAPMFKAWRGGAEQLEDRYVPASVTPSSYVRVLRTKNPKSSYSVVKKIVDQTRGAFESVSDLEIHDGLRSYYSEPYFRRFTRETGRYVGLEAATALAGVIRARRSGLIQRGQRVLLNVSGMAKPGDVKAEWVDDLL